MTVEGDMIGLENSQENLAFDMKIKLTFCASFICASFFFILLSNVQFSV